MSTKSSIYRLLLVGGLCAIVAVAWAQPVSAPGQTKKADDDLATFRTAVANAKELGKHGNTDAVEQLLTPLNHAPANSAQWHIETAQRLIGTAEDLTRDALPGAAAALAQAAMRHLSTAESLAPSPSVLAAAKTLEGFIQERYLGDLSSALSSFKAAAQSSPDDKRAAEAAERTQRTTDTLHGKQGGK
jgi:hypothetical protein